MNNLSTEPICPHFKICSGCEIFLDEIPPIWKSVLSFFAPFSIEPNLHRAQLSGWRLKSKLVVRGTVKAPLIGLFKKGTHETIPIPKCLVHHPAINKAVSLILKEIQESKISIYNETTQKGTLRYLQFFVDRSTGLVQLGLILNEKELDPHLKIFCKKLTETNPWHSIWVNFQPEKTNRILGSSWQKIEGADWLYQPLLGQLFAFHPGAFSQAHLALFEQLLQTIQSWVPKNSHLVELFAGVGAIGLSLPYEKLLLIENNPFGQASFHAHPFQSPRCEYRVQDATQFDEFVAFDTVIVDPPRKGMGPQLLKKLSEAKNLRLIYISCGWESFQKEALELTASGWVLQKAEGFLLFPGTNHVEIVALFERAKV